MNEELLQKLYTKYNLSQKGSYDQFKTDMADSAIQRRFFDKYGLSQKGSFEQFQTDLGGVQQQLPSPFPKQPLPTTGEQPGLPAQEERSILGALPLIGDVIHYGGKAVERGFYQGQTADVINPYTSPEEITPEAIQDVARYQQEIQKRGEPTFVKEGIWTSLAKRPLTTLTELITESLASTATHGATRIAGGAAMGAGVGLTGLGVGAVPGAATGAMAAGVEAGGNVEYSAKILQSLSEMGIDTTNPDEIVRAFTDPQLNADLKEKALRKAIPIMAFDALSAGIAGKFLGKAIAKGTSKAVAGLKEMGTQMATGASGELAGQISAGEPVDFQSISAEAIGELGGGGVETLTGTVANKPATKQETVNKIVASIPVEPSLAQQQDQVFNEGLQDLNVEEQNAFQEQSTTGVDVRQQTTDGNQVAEGNTQEKGTTQEGQLSETIKVYRGTGRNLGTTTNEGFDWVAEDQSVAENYATSKEAIEERTIPRPQNPLSFPFKTNVDVRSSNIADILREEVRDNYESELINETQLNELLDLIDQYETKAGSNLEKFHTKINKPEISGLFSDIVSKLGNDSVVVYETNKEGNPTATYGLIKPKTGDVNKILADKKEFDDAYQAFMEDPSDENAKRLQTAQQALQAPAQPSTRTVPFQQQISELGKLEPGQEFTDKARTIIEQSAFPEETKRELLGLLNVPKMNLNDKNKLVKALEKAAGTSTTTIKETTLRDKLREAWRQGISLGVKDAETRVKNLVGNALEIIKEAGAKLPPAKYEAIIRRIKSLNTKNEAKVLETLDYVGKVAEDAKYGERIDNIKSLQAKLKDPRVAADKVAIKRLRKVNPIDIANLDEFEQILNDVIANQKDATVPPVKSSRLNDVSTRLYSESQKAKMDRMIDAKAAKSEEFTDEKALVEDTQKEQYLEQLDSMLEEIEDYETAKTDQLFIEDLEKLKKIKPKDLEQLSTNELYTFIGQLNELFTNDRFTFYEDGTPSVLAKLDVIRKTAESSQEPTLGKDLVVPRSTTNLTADLMRLVKGLQSRIGPFMRVSGIDRLFNAGSKADVEYHKVRSKIHDGIKKLKKTYKDIKSPENLTAMQIYGMLTLKKTGVSEKDMIQAGIDNYKQTARKYKEGNPPDNVREAAERIDKVIALFDGLSTYSEVEKTMEKNYPGAKKLEELLSSALAEYKPTADALAEGVFNKAPEMFEDGTYYPVTVRTEKIGEIDKDYKRGSFIKQQSPTALLDRELRIPANAWVEMDDVNGVLKKLKEIINAKHLAKPTKQLESFLQLDRENDFKYTGSETNNLAIQHFIAESKQERYATNELDNFFNEVRRTGSIIYLSGIASAARQLLPALGKIHFDFTAKRVAQGKRPIVPIANWAAKKFAKAIRSGEAIASRSERVSGGFVGDAVETRKAFKDSVNKLYDSVADFTEDYVKPATELPSKLTFTAADQIGANEAWNVAYLDYLESKGENIDGYLFDDFWEKEYSKRGEPLREEARAAANAYVDTNFIESGKLNVNPFYKNNIWFSYIFPYLKFQRQKASVMADRYRALFKGTPEERNTAARQLTSDYIEAVTYQWITSMLLENYFQPLMDSLFRKGEEPSEEEKEKLAKLKKGFRWIETITALIPGGRWFFTAELIPDFAKQWAWNRMLRNFDENDNPDLTDTQWAKETELPAVAVTPQRARGNIMDAVINTAMPFEKYKLVEDNGTTYLEYEGFGGNKIRKSLTEEEIADIEITAIEQIIGWGLADYRGALNRIKRDATRSVTGSKKSEGTLQPFTPNLQLTPQLAPFNPTLLPK